MARKCPITGKAPVSGNARSHSLIATRRRWNVNLQKVKLADGSTIMMSTRARRTLNKVAKASKVEETVE